MAVRSRNRWLRAIAASITFGRASCRCPWTAWPKARSLPRKCRMRNCGTFNLKAPGTGETPVIRPTHSTLELDNYPSPFLISFSVPRQMGHQLLRHDDHPLELDFVERPGGEVEDHVFPVQ